MEENNISAHKCRWSPTLGALEDTAENIWGTQKYTKKDRDEPTVFFGVYGLPDFYVLWRHRGKKWILWAGSDILNFKKGYWLDERGKIRIDCKPLAKWIDKYCVSYVENKVEYEALKEEGIDSIIIPSFLGNIDDYPLSYRWKDRPQLYTSVSGDNFEMYGWDKIDELAKDNPEVDFHLYGNIRSFPIARTNVYEHGRVPKWKMNKEIKEMQGALRLTEHDGFSEIIAKSLLWGQWPVSLIQYEHTFPVRNIGELKNMRNANIDGRNYYRNIINKFPWVK